MMPIVGCVLAGAVGDALGAAVEFKPMDKIRGIYGPQGVTGMEDLYGAPGMITDDTQMLLFTLEGLLLAKRGGGNPVLAIQAAYQRWLHTQDKEMRPDGLVEEAPKGGWLVDLPAMNALRAPGNTCLTALRSARRGRASSLERPLNDSKGCGVVMRTAPIALWSDDPSVVFEIAARTGAHTHGHPSGYLSGGVMAVLVQQLLLGEKDLVRAAQRARAELVRWRGHEEQAEALDRAIRIGTGKAKLTPELIEGELGAGWVGEEALAIGLAAALAGKDMREALLLAVNHSGDSDSTGSVCGNLLGARDGVSAIPQDWLRQVELAAMIEWLCREADEAFAPTGTGWGGQGWG
ncbi:crystallin J1 [Actinosynnema pretiosum]|uniref:Crystallin J1 n=2 Tax=Actinosynnema pretiosum TaxID=42197 RepID=A0A290ZET6_9PSEU|nr:crystallin J1 [Actinosynnema pretiosum]